jgi:hypothetical protein
MHTNSKSQCPHCGYDYSIELGMKKETKEQTAVIRYDTMVLGFAIAELGEAISSQKMEDCLRHAQNAQKYINEFANNVAPSPALTEKEADYSASLHTYMRKGMIDSPLGSMMWSLINESRGEAIWFAFIKAVANSKYVAKEAFHEGMKAAKEQLHKGHNTTDDWLMYSCLQMWEEGFPDALEWIGEES